MRDVHLRNRTNSTKRGGVRTLSRLLWTRGLGKGGACDGHIKSRVYFIGRGGTCHVHLRGRTNFNETGAVRSLSSLLRAQGLGKSRACDVHLTSRTNFTGREECVTFI